LREITQKSIDAANFDRKMKAAKAPSPAVFALIIAGVQKSPETKPKLAAFLKEHGPTQP